MNCKELLEKRRNIQKRLKKKNLHLKPRLLFLATTIFISSMSLSIHTDAVEEIPRKAEKERKEVPFVAAQMNKAFKATVEVAYRYIEETSYNQEKTWIEYYSNYYKVDALIAYELASKLTDNFQSEEYLSTYNIGNTIYHREQKTFTNQEIGIMVFIRNLSQIPEHFGLTKEDIKTQNYIPYEKKKEILIGELADKLNMDKALVLAIIYHESGRLTSDAYQFKNNPSGMMASGKLMTFPTPEAGIIETILNIYYLFYADGKNYTWEEIRDIYAPLNAENDPQGLNRHWLPNVKAFYEEIKENAHIFKEETINPKELILT